MNDHSSRSIPSAAGAVERPRVLSDNRPPQAPPPRPAPPGPYTVATHDGEEPFSTIRGLSYDAARHIAQTHAGMEMVAEVRSEREDYRELYEPDGTVRTFDPMNERSTT